MKILIVGGLGDTGQRLISKLIRENEVVVTTREQTEEVPPEVKVVEADPLEKDHFCTEIMKISAERPFDVVYNLLGAWLQNPRQVIYEGTRNIVAALQNESPVFVFCSATTVYGHRPGEILDEDSPLQPDMEIGVIQRDTEEFLLQQNYIKPVILRTPHIYGPGRERTFELMKQGRFIIVGDGQNPMHHIYIKDFINVLIAAAKPEHKQQIFNIVDDIAEPYRAYCDFITESMGIDPLPCYTYEEAKASNVLVQMLGPHFTSEKVLSELYRYMTSHAVISNNKMKEKLGITLQYPSFRDGLREMLEI